VSYDDVITQKLGVIDGTAVLLAQQHRLPIRVFNLSAPDALVRAHREADFGSWIKSPAVAKGYGGHGRMTKN